MDKHVAFNKKMALPKIIIKFFMLHIGLLYTVFIYGQEGIAKRRTIMLRDSNLTMKVHILNTAPDKLKCSDDLTYYYHHKGGIHQSQGGYTGSLLDGAWESHFSSNVLSTQGIFEQGLKSGTWRYWQPNGKLLREEAWKAGKLHGHFVEYDTDGYPAKMGRYRKGQLHGAVSMLEGGKVVERNRYRKGELVVKRPFRFGFKKQKDKGL
jgi:antitoxin component YwqK of YwqJK toxin-antitoxin module